MKLLVFSMIATVAFAAPQGYTLSQPGGPGLLVSREHSVNGGAQVSGISTLQESSIQNEKEVGIALSTGTSPDSEVSLGGEVAIREDVNIEFSTGDFASECPEGQVRHVDGSCVAPEITRKIFLFSVPKQEQQRSDSVQLPPPKVDHNILFVRLPEGGVGPEPIVVPPPRQENIIYVLSKQSEYGQRVIEVPAPPPSEPEIYFVNYEEGENPALPGGFDLHTALGSAATASGQVLGVVEGDSNIEVTGSGVDIGGNAVLEVSDPQTIIGVSTVETSGSRGVAEVGLDSTPSGSPSGLYTTP